MRYLGWEIRMSGVEIRNKKFELRCFNLIIEILDIKNKIWRLNCDNYKYLDVITHLLETKNEEKYETKLEFLMQS